MSGVGGGSRSAVILGAGLALLPPEVFLCDARQQLAQTQPEQTKRLTRRQEKDLRALAKADEKRRRRAAKRLAETVRR